MSWIKMDCSFIFRLSGAPKNGGFKDFGMQRTVIERVPLTKKTYRLSRKISNTVPKCDVFIFQMSHFGSEKLKVLPYEYVRNFVLLHALKTKIMNFKVAKVPIQSLLFCTGSNWVGTSMGAFLPLTTHISAISCPIDPKISVRPYFD